jgi:hypothetical protein
MNFYYNNWCVYKDGKLVVDNYDNHITNVHYIDALATQARCIYNSNDNVVLFLSGGIDSQSKALGFLAAGINVKCVFVKYSYEGNYNNIELFYTTHFCKKHNIDLEIFEVNYTKQSLQQLLIEYDYLHSCTGSGSMFQIDAIRKFTEGKDVKVVTGHGGFTMTRKGDTCYGYFKQPNAGILIDVDMENTIAFDMYAPFVYKYYEHFHKASAEIQVLLKYEGKNLAFTELHMPFRQKLCTWEFLAKKDYGKVSTINWADTQASNTRLPGVRGASMILNALGIKNTEDFINNKPWVSMESCEIELYSFKTNIEFPF